MKIFTDYYGNTVRLSFSENSFSKNPQHVFVICRHNGKWVLTKHKKRGLEFPGGKREAGETLVEAAKREVFEETGGVVEEVTFIGQYEVSGENDSFVKNIYFAEIKYFEKRPYYYETFGPVLVDSPLTPDELTKEYSFIMKDDVVQECMKRLKMEGLVK